MQPMLAHEHETGPIWEYGIYTGPMYNILALVPCYLKLLRFLNPEPKQNVFKLTSRRTFVWSTRLWRHLAAAILFRSLRLLRLSSSSGVIWK